ncbi:hypothetical protein F511_21188 [Dorcoceras hygrometricum]|uniref:Uncharacterized protein n=1 Tax=Dorcoceras hygrometricum TaxID=472368 RepID=A0A2Z7AJF6_9LAMI|nr:hypothetical protein F511_21188 [Dorcoceras hygrometricum]
MKSIKCINVVLWILGRYKSSEGETSTQSQLVYDKFNKMSFVKANVIYDCCESMKYDEQNSSQLNQKGKAGIGYSKPENSKPCWLKNKLDKDEAKAGRKTFVPNQSWRSSTKGQIFPSVPAAGSEATNVQPDDTRSDVAQADASVSHLVSRPTSEIPAASTDYQLASTSTAGHQDASTSSLHIAFDSVFDMDDAGLVQMFESFIATGLKEFLGGTTVEISEEIFAVAFELPMEGLTDLSEVPKDLVFDARSHFSESKEHVSISYHKREMKIEYRLLSDILAKTIYVKAGSFDAVTSERFLLMTAITFDVKVNWSRLLFDILKDMVTPGSRQAKGYAIQICVLLKNVPGLDLGDCKAFPSPRIFTEKTVHRYVVINEKVGAEEVTDEPRVKKEPKTKAASKKRPAGVVATEPVAKKKRATKKKSGLDNVPVAQKAVPIQIIEPIPTAPVEEPIVEESREATSAVPIDEEISAEEQSDVEVAAATDVQEPAVEHVDEQVAEKTADEETAVKDDEMIDEPVSLPAEAAVVNKDVYTAAVVDVIIEQVLAETFHIGADEEEQDVDTSDIGDNTAETTDREKHWADAAADLFVEEPVDDVEVTADEQSVGERTDADEAMSLDDIILSIPVDVPLPYACVEITKITLGKDIKIPRVDERTWYLASLPQIPVDDKGNEPFW